MDLTDIKNALLKHQQICSKILTIKYGGVLQPGTYFTRSSIYRIFYTHQEHPFSRTPASVCYSFFLLQCVKREFPLFFLCFFKKSDAMYLFPTNRLLSIVIDKFITVEFTILIRNVPFLVLPSPLGEHIYGGSVILRKGIFQISPGCLPHLLSLRPILQVR